MGKGQGSGNAWYAIKNIVGALLFMFVAMLAGPLAWFIGSIALYVLGVLTILYALARIGEGSIVGTIVEILIGVAIIAAANWIQPWGMMETISTLLSGVIITIVGWSQRVKRRDRYANGTKYEKRLKGTATLLVVSIMIGGIVIIVGSVLCFIAPHIKIITQIPSYALVACGVGVIAWIAYTIMVLKVLKKTGMTINDYKTKRSKNGGSSSSAPRTTQSRSSGGANESKVRSEMNSVANYFSGGWDYVGSKAQIKYGVTVSVSGGVVDFMLSCRLDGQVTQAEFDTAKSKVNSLIEKKQKAIMDRAMNRLNAIGPDRDYSVGVDVSTQ